LQPTWERLGAGGGSLPPAREPKLENQHRLSDEPHPRLRQTASYTPCILLIISRLCFLRIKIANAFLHAMHAFCTVVARNARFLHAY